MSVDLTTPEALSPASATKAFEHAPVGLALLAPHGELLSANRALYALVGAADVSEVRAALGGGLAGLVDGRTLERCHLRADGTCTWLALRTTPTGPGSEVLVLAAEDVTERRRGERALAHRATHDPLTGLPNRALFLDRLEGALARSARSGRTVAVLFCDLDGFKPVNDRFGHLAGDEVLATLAGRIRAALRPDDTVARLGGDEFAVLRADLSDPAEAAAIVERVSGAVSRPVPVDGEGGAVAAVGVSIGVATSEGGHGPVELLDLADRAMYAAKGAARS